MLGVAVAVGTPLAVCPVVPCVDALVGVAVAVEGLAPGADPEDDVLPGPGSTGPVAPGGLPTVTPPPPPPMMTATAIPTPASPITAAATPANQPASRPPPPPAAVMVTVAAAPPLPGRSTGGASRPPAETRTADPAGSERCRMTRARAAAAARRPHDCDGADAGRHRATAAAATPEIPTPPPAAAAPAPVLHQPRLLRRSPRLRRQRRSRRRSCRPPHARPRQRPYPGGRSALRYPAAARPSTSGAMTARIPWLTSVSSRTSPRQRSQPARWSSTWVVSRLDSPPRA